jgi:hypothetical protein
LFTYSIARYISIKNNAELVIDNVSGFSRDYEFNRSYQLDHFCISSRKAKKSERLEPFPRLRRKILKWYSYFFQFQFRRFVYQDNIDFERRMLNLKCKKKLFLEGYWQSESYFKDIEAVIRKDLKIIPPNDSLNLSLAESMSKCVSVAIHVRFFNPVGEATTSNVCESYYREAINEIQSRLKVEHFFIFSDNPELARELLALDVNSSTLISHNKGDENSYADMWLMTKCKHFIIANSTFSWWGAWLSNYPNKVVIAPKSTTKYNGTISWGFDGLLPDEWIKL